MDGSDMDEEPQAWLASMLPEGATEYVRVMLDGREGEQVFVRLVDPSDGDPPPVPIYAGDKVVPMLALSHASLNTAAEAGDDDEMIVAMRIVPVRREDGVVFVRTLRHREPDNGDRVHVRPGESVTIEAGAMSLDLAAIDAKEASLYEDTSCYVPLTPVLGAWFAIGNSHDPAKVRYILAAARRLDAAQSLLDRVGELRVMISSDGLTAGQRRRHALDLVRTIEIAVVAIGRVSHMIQKARTTASIATAISSRLNDSHAAIKEIRDAYEHIEERAVGKVFRTTSPTALEIFDYGELLLNHKIVYGSHSLDLVNELPQWIIDARKFLVEAAGDA